MNVFSTFFFYMTGKQLICDYRMTCSSDNGLQKDCPVNGDAKIVNMTVIKHKCGPRRGNWNLDDICGYHDGILWVKHGCYIWFSVCYISKFCQRYIYNLTNDEQIIKSTYADLKNKF